MRQQIVTYYLEMTHPAQIVPACKPHPAFSLIQVEIPCPPLNRFLYTAVGGAWYWLDRLEWSYAQWQRYLEQEGVETWVAYIAGTPAGYFELEKQAGGNVEIAYFGLLTCSLDHPHALPGYQARGFHVFNSVQTAQDLPERSPGPWPGAFPGAGEG